MSSVACRACRSSVLRARWLVFAGALGCGRPLPLSVAEPAQPASTSGAASPGALAAAPAAASASTLAPEEAPSRPPPEPVREPISCTSGLPEQSCVPGCDAEVFGCAVDCAEACQRCETGCGSRKDAAACEAACYAKKDRCVTGTCGRERRAACERQAAQDFKTSYGCKKKDLWRSCNDYYTCLELCDPQQDCREPCARRVGCNERFIARITGAGCYELAPPDAGGAP